MESNNSFFTNIQDNTLVNRFNKILKDTEYFDCLVGYFYVSGFYKLQEKLESTEKIRILVGMGIDSQTFELIEDSKESILSTADFKKKFKSDIVSEMNNSENSLKVEKSAKKFIEWLKEGKVEIKGYKERKTHSKLYIMSFPENFIDEGRVITGSSNFTQPGLEYNLEFNVELRRDNDYKYAKEQFEELWELSEPITEDFINTLTQKTWLKEDITPYELYLKFIYEFLYDKIWNDEKEMDIEYYPPNFKYLDYQRDAVLDAKSKIEEYGGVFLSDVVGLGKTYMGALLAQQLKGTTLVIAPPALIDEHNIGGWKRTLKDFEVKSIVESSGKLDQILKNYETNHYQNVIIDESHNFRNEETEKYEYLSKICKGKNVILISATPFNNSPADLLSQIKLFQPAHNSTLPNPKVRDLENYFKNLEKQQKNIDKEDNPEEYLDISDKIAADIRENVLQYVMVRRTRNTINKYYSNDLKKNKFEFPKIKKPIKVFYEFDENINTIFEETLSLINKNITYAKYRPLAQEYQVEPDNSFFNSQKMMGNFIKILLIKRLESGCYAFKKSIDNSVISHQKALKILEEKGEFYTSRDYGWKILNFVEDGDIDKVDDLLNKNKVKVYFEENFTPKFKNDLKNDLKILKHIQKLWDSVDNYPKRLKLVNLLNDELKDKKVIIFTEFIDTAKDLTSLIKRNCEGNVKLFTGQSSKEDMDDVLFNFDANQIKDRQKDDFRILVTTDTLSHGVNLHRSNVIINYDIPWNPTKIMQRVGRVQRLGTKFNEIYIYNFFPTEPIEDEINIELLAQNKINMFIELLGNDSQLLTDEPIRSFDLFNKINSTEILDETEVIDDELRYLHLIREIRDKDKELFKKIENIPKKAKVCRCSNDESLITLMKFNKFKKVFETTSEGTVEIDFFDAIKKLEAKPEENGIKFNDNYYNYLNKNINAFTSLLNEPEDDIILSRNEKSIINYISYALQDKEKLTSYDINMLVKVKELTQEGHITKKQAKKINSKLKDIGGNQSAILDILRKNIRTEDLKTSTHSDNENKKDFKEIILSEYFQSEV